MQCAQIYVAEPCSVGGRRWGIIAVKAYDASVPDRPTRRLSNLLSSWWRKLLPIEKNRLIYMHSWVWQKQHQIAISLKTKLVELVTYVSSAIIGQCRHDGSDWTTERSSTDTSTARIGRVDGWQVFVLLSKNNLKLSMCKQNCKTVVSSFAYFCIYSDDVHVNLSGSHCASPQ